MNETIRKSFDLEQGILSTWNILGDLRTLNENIMENDFLTKDDIVNVLLGLTTLYELKFDDTFRTFETVHGGLCRMNKELTDKTNEVIIPQVIVTPTKSKMRAKKLTGKVKTVAKKAREILAAHKPPKKK